MINSDFFMLVALLVIESSSLLIIFCNLTKIHVPIRLMILLPITSMIIFAFLNYFFFVFLIVYFFCIGKFIGQQTNTKILWFYSVYTVFSYALFGYILGVSLDFLLGETTYVRYSYLIEMLLTPIISIVISSLIAHLIRPSLLFLNKYSEDNSQIFLLFINLLLTSCCIIQFSNYWIERYLLKGENPFRKYLIAVFILVIVLLIVYLNIKTRQLDKQRIQELKDNQLADLTSYVQQIETMYGELRSFRHDYHNVLISLNESIKSKDLAVIENTYNQVLNSEGLTLDDEHYSLARLDGLKTLPIKGVFSAHIIQAWQKNIPVHIEIDDTIQDEPIEILDYVRITSILLDNAIEAAEKSENPFLTIVFLKNQADKELQLIIENSCPNEPIDITKVFKKDYSTKGENRGLGLATVQSILQNYTNLSLQTEYQLGVFRQVLMIKEEISR